MLRPTAVLEEQRTRLEGELWLRGESTQGIALILLIETI